MERDINFKQLRKAAIAIGFGFFCGKRCWNIVETIVAYAIYNFEKKHNPKGFEKVKAILRGEDPEIKQEETDNEKK